MNKPKRKVTIVYTYSFMEDRQCEARLEWNPTGKRSDSESITAYAKTFAEAKALVIGKYMLVPETETIELGGK
jgi:hypothetical protein